MKRKEPAFDEIRNHNRKLKAFRSEDDMCDVIKIAQLPRNRDGYSMIKIEFNELADQSELNAASIANYVGVKF